MFFFFNEKKTTKYNPLSRASYIVCKVHIFTIQYRENEYSLELAVPMGSSRWVPSKNNKKRNFYINGNNKK